MTVPRVAYVLLWFPEPSQTFVLDEVNTLVRLGLEVRVFTLYGPRPAARLAGLARPAAAIRRLGLRALPLLLRDLALVPSRYGHKAWPFLSRLLLRRWRTLETAGEALWAALAGAHLAGVFKAQGIGHIHAPWADGPATAAWAASYFSGIPFSFSARARDLHPPDGALLEKMAAAKLVRTNTLANRDYLAGLAPQCAHKLVNVYNGVSLAAPARRELAAGPPHRLLAIGRLVPKKGFATLVEAVRLLVQQGQDIDLTIAGDGPERRRLAELVQRCGLGGRVSLPGFAPHAQVPGLLAAAHLLVMPSQIAPSGDRDGIPNVILEALAAETPVVATPVAGIPEVIRPGDTGWLAPPENPQAIAAAIAAALADPDAARRLARRGQALVRREFDSRENYGRLKRCFHQAMGRGGSL